MVYLEMCLWGKRYTNYATNVAIERVLNLNVALNRFAVQKFQIWTEYSYYFPLLTWCENLVLPRLWKFYTYIMWESLIQDFFINWWDIGNITKFGRSDFTGVSGRLTVAWVRSTRKCQKFIKLVPGRWNDDFLCSSM